MKLFNILKNIALMECSNNHIRFPNGILIQWGNKTGTVVSPNSNVSVTVDLPYSFLNTVYNVSVTPETTLANQIKATANSHAVSSFSLNVGSTYTSTVTASVRWLAVGRWK